MNPQILALICAVLVFVLVVIALVKGIDGVALAVGLTIIGGLGGYGVTEIYHQIKRKKSA